MGGGLRVIAGVAVVAWCIAAAPLADAAGTIPLDNGNTTFNVHVMTLKEMHFRRVVHQEYDFSCGSAALATLLTYHYERPVRESTVLQAMFKVGDQPKIRKEGFSLLDMKKYLASIGYKSDGYKVSLDKIAQVGIPGIALIKTKGYLHFVVLKGIRGDDVLLGDPALGTKLITRQQFQSIWNGIFFVITGDTREAKKEFNANADWVTVAQAPLAAVVAARSLADLTLMTPGRSSF